MNKRPFDHSGRRLLGSTLVALLAALVSGCAQADQSAPTPVGTGEDSQLPAEFARRGLSLLQKDGVTEPDTVKADALIMRAWNLQQAYPQSCGSVWQLTNTLVAQQSEPSQKHALVSLYLNAVDAAVESAATPDAFEASWAVRQEVLAEIERHRHDVLAAIESSLKEALAALSRPDGIQQFVDKDAARWASLSAELNATIEPLKNPPPSIVGIVSELNDKLVQIFDEKLARLRGQLKEDASASPEPSETDESRPQSQPTDAKGQITQLLEELDELARMRESESVTSWIELAARLKAPRGRQGSIEAGDNQIVAMDALRSKALEMRVLKYNLWAADAIYNADRRGADGLFVLGQIETRLLMGAVATSYSITEGKILNAIPDPFARQVRIREMLSQTKKQLLEF